MEAWDSWQKPFQFGTIVIWPPEEIREIVNGQRARYDPVSQSICEAHITITQPVVRSLDDAEWNQIWKLLQEYEAFEIHFGPLNSFLPYPCIWYEVHPQAGILEIRTALHETGFFNLEIKHPENFTPHMTITEGLSGPNVDENLLDQLKAESSSGSFFCEDLAYIVPDEQFRFQVVKMFPLVPTQI